MKKIIAFFVLVYNWFISLFKTKKEVIKEEETSASMIKWQNKAKIPKHNNRKSKKRRFVQYINIGEGKERAIYHTSK